jgi:hypothetical protein
MYTKSVSLLSFVDGQRGLNFSHFTNWFCFGNLKELQIFHFINEWFLMNLNIIFLFLIYIYIYLFILFFPRSKYSFVKCSFY